MLTAPRYALPLLATAAALAAFVGLELLMLMRAGGFEYPLDDPYIHLAMAEGIRAGGYGINPGEAASAASSALFPLLLTPLEGPGQRLLPLVWNLVGVIATAWLWGVLMARSGWGGATGVALAALGPVAILSPAVATIGMEHTLHAAASLAVIAGLSGALTDRDDAGAQLLVVLGAAFATALRLEGLALGLLAAVALWGIGSRGWALATVAATLAPALGFMAWLTSLGLDPLPGSVLTKLGANTDLAANPLVQRFTAFALNLNTAGGLWLLLLAMATLALSRRLTRPWGWLAAVLVLATLAHLAFGQIGWLDRYEHYILTIASAGLLALWPRLGLPRPAALLVVAVPLAIYLPGSLRLLPWSSKAIAIQQGQMASFARGDLDAPVAVNDIGYVSWMNDNYVLDLYGLALPETRAMWAADPVPDGWAGTLAEAHNVPAAMIYDKWFGAAVGADWVRLGALVMTEPRGFLGDAAVAFYATGPEHVPTVKAALENWLPTLADGSYWVVDNGGGDG